MKSKISILLLLISLQFSNLSAQWNQLTAPELNGICSPYLFAEFQNKYFMVALGGIYMSENQGELWNMHNGDLPGNPSISRLLIHNNQFYIATSGGIYKSGNGENWNKIYTNTNLYKMGNDLYTIKTDTDNKKRFYKSSDDGSTWISQGVEIPAYNQVFEIQSDRIYFLNGTNLKWTQDGITYNSINTSDFPAGGVLGTNYYERFTGNNQYLFINIIASNTIKFYRLDLANGKWEIINTGLPINYYAGTMWYEGTSLWGMINTSGSIKLCKSTDNGNNWLPTPYQMFGKWNESAFRIFTAGGKLIGFFNNDLYTESNKYSGIYYISRNILISSDQGTNWEIKQTGLHRPKIHHLIDINNTLLTFIDFRGILRSTDKGTTWEYRTPWGAVNRQQAVTDFMKTDNAVFIKTDNNEFYKSLNQGDTWTVLSTPANFNPIYTDLFATEAGLIFCRGYNTNAFKEEFYKSNDYGATWILVNTLFTGNYEGLEGITGNSNVLYAYGSQPFIQKSIDNGITWTTETNGLTTTNRIAQLIISGDFVYAFTYESFGGFHLFRKQLNGTEWTELSSTAFPESELARMYSKNNVIYFLADDFGTKGTSGLFYSKDQGNSWMKYEDGLESGAVISCLAFTNDKIIAGTNYNGLWINDALSTGISNISDESIDLTIFPNPSADYIYTDLKDNALAIVYDLSGKIMLSGEISNQKPLDIISIETGAYVIRVVSDKGIFQQKLIKQ